LPDFIQDFGALQALQCVRVVGIDGQGQVEGVFCVCCLPLFNGRVAGRNGITQSLFLPCQQLFHEFKAGPIRGQRLFKLPAAVILITFVGQCHGPGKIFASPLGYTNFLQLELVIQQFFQNILRGGALFAGLGFLPG